MQHYYDMAHKRAIADGGGSTDPDNLKPQLHSEHMQEHTDNGDFSRWGKRANQSPGDDDVTPLLGEHSMEPEAGGPNAIGGGGGCGFDGSEECE